MNFVFFSALFFFAFSFTVFQIQSSDVLMYLSMARDFILPGQWPHHDPYLYSRPTADLQMAHEYLSYLLFYGAWWLAGWTGLELLKAGLLAALFWWPLAREPHRQNRTPLWIGLWTLAVVAASFRFIERSSLISDLLCLITISWLLDAKSVSRTLVLRLTLLMVAWVQFHPGYPLALALIGIWTLWHWIFEPSFRNRRVLWLALPVMALILNPKGLTGALYPFSFGLHEAQIFKRYNYEWFPSYSAAFRWSPEVCGFWVLALASISILWRDRLGARLEGVFALFCLGLGTIAVRFVPLASFALLLTLKPWLNLKLPWRRHERLLNHFLIGFLIVIGIKNLAFGYNSSSGFRRPGFGLDASRFPLETVKFLEHNAIPGRLYNTHDMGNYLVWSGHSPVFHHGFVTDMDLYQNEVVGVLSNPETFFRLAKTYNWTMLLVDKIGNYPYFYKILSPHPEWRIVAEDESSYLIYLFPPAGE